MLNYRGDIYLGSVPNATIKGACTKGWNLFAVTTEPRIRKYTTDTLTLVASGANLGGSTPSGITFITPVSMAISFSSTTRVEIWDSNTLASAAITTGISNQTKRAFHQQIAGNPNINLGMQTQSFSAMTLVSPTCCCSIAPTFLSGRSTNCVIARPDAGTWIIGTDQGKIFEMTSAGVLVSTVHVPSGPIWGSAPTINITSLAYSPSYLLAATDCGQLLHYDWNTKTLLNQIPINFNGTANSISTFVMSNAPSGICLIGESPTVSNWNNISEMHFTPKLAQESSAVVDINVGLLDAGINPDSRQGWIIFNENNFLQLRVYDMPQMGQVNVSTTIQDPPGVYGSGRIIRIRDSGPGTASVDYDGVIPNVATNIASTDGKNYIELGLIGNTITGLGPYTSWDIRQMEA